jgi:GGDEF domain-containing protein
VTTSIGIALSPPHRTEDLLRFADSAMYQAKAASRGSVVIYEEKTDS